MDGSPPPSRKPATVTAVEPFRNVPATPGLTALRDSVEEVELPEHSFEAAVLWHVLEPSCGAACGARARKGLARTRGRVLVGVPNLASLQARLGSRAVVPC
jgi:hypothetical protein